MQRQLMLILGLMVVWGGMIRHVSSCMERIGKGVACKSLRELVVASLLSPGCFGADVLKTDMLPQACLAASVAAELARQWSCPHYQSGLLSNLLQLVAKSRVALW